MPLFHHFNVNDNIVLLISSLSRLSAWLMRALAKTSGVFYASTGAGILCMLTSAPIRAQMSRCVPSEDLGKVNIMQTSNNIYHILFRFLPCWQAWSHWCQFWPVFCTLICIMQHLNYNILGREVSISQLLVSQY